VRDPRGHSHGREEGPPPYVEPERWRENEAFLYGVDLYNLGYLWEAHEAWEGAWIASRADPDQADVLQGLIQCAAATLKIPMGQPAGLAKLAALGLARLERVGRERGPVFMGLDLEAFARAFRAFAAGEAPDPERRPRIELAP
jgi:hypothetical protein